MSNLELITQEINGELEKAEIQKVLLSTTFKGLSLGTMKTAMFEGMTRGFSFKNFLQKDIYAIPFKDSYSLITSIDYARKVGMRSGIVGKSEPIFEEQDGKIISCAITVKRKIDEYIGEYSSKVYFSEYTTGRNLWATKPRTMIAKVAEMHALRMACPEELAQAYVEEEMEREITPVINEKITDEIKKEVEDCVNEESLNEVYKKHSGLGKDFDKLVVAHREFIKNADK